MLCGPYGICGILISKVSSNLEVFGWRVFLRSCKQGFRCN